MLATTQTIQKYGTSSAKPGFVDDNPGVHEARIEYFLLTAQFDLALRQIEFAKRDKSLTPSDTFRLEQREREAKALREEMKQMF